MTSGTGDTGRDEQFKTLYRQYYRRIMRFYMRSFRFSPDEAEDLTQEAFLRFFQKIDDYRGESEWTFFETIARNVAYNRIRAARTLKRNAPTVEIDDPDVHEKLPAAVQPDFVALQEASAQRR